MKASFDTYTVQARLFPGLIVVLPAALAVGVWIPVESAGWKALGTIVTSFGLTALLAQLGRDWEKRKETFLFALWGGIPTTRLLSHRHTTLDRTTLARYHAKLRTLLTVTLPTAQREQQNPSAADEEYESCVRFLRERTRDPKRFPLVFAENVNYGFRRNLWAMKALAIPVAVAGIAGCGFSLHQHSSPSSPFALVALAINLVLLSVWVFVLKPSWVRLAAEAYAERLLGAIDAL